MAGDLCPTCGRCPTCGQPQYDLQLIVPGYPYKFAPMPVTNTPWNVCITPPPAGPGPDVVPRDDHPSDEGHGDDGDLLAGP